MTSGEHGLLKGFESIALLDDIVFVDAPVMGPMDLLAPADDVGRREARIFQHPFQVFTLPTNMVGLFLRCQHVGQKFYR
jgi:hypothetical protein